MPQHTARRGLAVAAGALGLLAGFGGVAAAGPSTIVKGSPQPELAPFVLAHTGGDPSAEAIGPDNTFIVVYTVKNDYKVCVLARGARACARTTTLAPQDGDSIFGNPQVFVFGDTIDVLMDQCCYAQPETPLIWQSTDAGRTFTPVTIGSASNANAESNVGTAVYADGDIVWVSGGGGSQPVDTVSVSDPYDNEQTANSVVPDGEGNNELEESGISTYKGGVLTAGGTFGGATKVYYAPAGADPGVNASYHSVGSFGNATFQFLEGGALITQETTGSTPFQIRLFNGTSFGPAHTIPATDGGGPQWFGATQSAAGRYYMFTERHQDSYDLEVEYSENGASWSPRTDFGSASYAYAFNAVLDGINSGIVVGSPNPVEVYPILAGQPVSFTLSKDRVTTGTTITGSGASGYPTAGRAVQLERLTSAGWEIIANSTETAAGKFSFHIRQTAAGTYTFRVSAADRPGYVQYGYSAGKVLTVVKPTH